MRVRMFYVWSVILNGFGFLPAISLMRVRGIHAWFVIQNFLILTSYKSRVSHPVSMLELLYMLDWNLAKLHFMCESFGSTLEMSPLATFTVPTIWTLLNYIYDSIQVYRDIFYHCVNHTKSEHSLKYSFYASKVLHSFI